MSGKLEEEDKESLQEKVIGFPRGEEKSSRVEENSFHHSFLELSFYEHSFLEVGCRHNC